MLSILNRAACWEVVSGMPETYNWMAVSPSSDPMDGAESQHIMNQLEAGEIDVKSDFLKCKVRDWSLIMGRGATKWENRGSVNFCSPPPPLKTG